MKVSVITLGCKVNEYESQSIMNEFLSAGYEVGEGLIFADIYVVNTCSVTNIGDRKSRQVLAKINKINPNAKIVFLCGSMLGGKELDICRQLLDEVAENAHRNGDDRVYRFDFSRSDGSLMYGADWHPSIWQHEKMAAELTAYLRTLMQWF